MSLRESIKVTKLIFTYIVGNDDYIFKDYIWNLSAGKAAKSCKDIEKDENLYYDISSYGLLIIREVSLNLRVFLTLKYNVRIAMT